MSRLACCATSLFLLSAACSGPEPARGTGETSAADGTTCSADYGAFLETTYLPRLAALATTDDAMRTLIALAATIPCGSPRALDPKLANYELWMAAFNDKVWGPWAHANHEAQDRFVSPISPFWGDRGVYNAATEPSGDVMFNARALDLVRPVNGSLFDVRETWLPEYGTTIDLMLMPTVFPTEIAVVDDTARSVWDLTPGESDFLAVVESTLPHTDGDGVYAEWLDRYYKLLTREPIAGGGDGTYPFREVDLGFHSLFSPPGSPCPRAKFLLRLTTGKHPESVGPQDRVAWLNKLTAVLISVITLGDGADFIREIGAEHLALFEAVRPPFFTGDEEYAAWLESFDLAASSSASLLRDHVLPIKPCVFEEVAGSPALDSFNQWRSKHADIPAETAALAAPMTCSP